MTIIFHKTKKPKVKDIFLHYDYFETATGKAPPKGFQLRVSVAEDPDVRIYERTFIKSWAI